MRAVDDEIRCSEAVGEPYYYRVPRCSWKTETDFSRIFAFKVSYLPWKVSTRLVSTTPSHLLIIRSCLVACCPCQDTRWLPDPANYLPCASAWGPNLQGKNKAKCAWSVSNPVNGFEYTS